MTTKTKSTSLQSSTRKPQITLVPFPEWRRRLGEWLFHYSGLTPDKWRAYGNNDMECALFLHETWQKGTSPEHVALDIIKVENL